MQTQPIPLDDISALLRKAETTPEQLTPEETERLVAVFADLGPALQKVADATSEALSGALAALGDSLLEALPWLEDYARSRAAVSTTCDRAIIVDYAASPCLLPAGHKGGCDPFNRA